MNDGNPPRFIATVTDQRSVRSAPKLVLCLSNSRRHTIHVLLGRQIQLIRYLTAVASVGQVTGRLICWRRRSSLMKNNREGLFTVLRLHLIRHGETEANVKGIVVGNGESPLTALGIQQARALGCKSRWLRDHRFDLIFSSDLERAKRTAALSLGELSTITSSCTDVDVIPSIQCTDRLRELAKGPRQGFLKILSLDEAISERKRLSMQAPFPLLETEEDGWKRMIQWLEGQIRFAVSKEPTAVAPRSMIHIIAFGHAGLFRVFLTRLIGKDKLFAHPDASFDVDGRFSVPNTSHTIVDIHLDPTLSENSHEKEDDLLKRIKEVEIVLLTSTEHCSNLVS